MKKGLINKIIEVVPATINKLNVILNYSGVHALLGCSLFYRN